jgi:hypothetical protein
MPDSAVLRKAGDAIMHLASPAGLTYSFADGGPGRAAPSPAQCWIAKQFKDATQTGHVRDLFTERLKEGRGKSGGERWFPLNILWLPPAAHAGDTVTANAAVFRGEQAMAMFRTGWEKSAAWLAIKGGTPAASHGHMDVGSFAYDAHGSRWLHDMGSENYNLPAYFGKRRWTYYRLQNRAHNTLEIGGQLQNPESKPCPLIASSLTGNPLSASFDLTDAYTGSAAKVIRSASFDRGSGRTLIEDEVTSPAGDVVWRVITDAEPEIRDDRVILKKQDHRITLRRVSDAGVWSVASAKPPTPEEKQNPGMQAVSLTVPKAGKVSIQVEIQP